MANATDKSTASDANTSAPKPAARKDDPKQTWVVGLDGKRYKSEDYAKTALLTTASNSNGYR